MAAYFKKLIKNKLHPYSYSLQEPSRGWVLAFLKHKNKIMKKQFYWLLVNFVLLCLAASLSSCSKESDLFEIECSHVIDYDRSYHCALTQFHLIEEPWNGDKKYTSYIKYPLEDGYELEIYLINFNNTERQAHITAFPSLRHELNVPIIRTMPNELVFERCGKYPKGHYDVTVELYSIKNELLATRQYKGTFDIPVNDVTRW